MEVSARQKTRVRTIEAIAVAYAPISRRGLYQMAIVMLAILTYFGVRAISEGSPARAYANAARVEQIENTLDIAKEESLQGVVLGKPIATTAVNWIYIYGHWPAILITLIVLHARRREHFFRLRNAMLVSGLLGFAFFLAVPVAPPRLFDPGTVDTVLVWSHSYRALQPPSLLNTYAAMPSLHAGWNLVVGIALFGAFKSKIIRAFAVVMPLAMMYSVVATGNHYVLDVVVGSALGATCYFAVSRRRRAQLATLHRNGHGPTYSS
jgi:membrane-associated phospholipid phosphatase